MLELVFLFLMRIGFFVYLFGRILIIRENRREHPDDFGIGWIISLLLLPLAELMCLVRYYKHTVQGATLSIIGMCMAVPWVGMELNQKQLAQQKNHSAHEVSYGLEDAMGEEEEEDEEDEGEAPPAPATTAIVGHLQPMTKRMIAREQRLQLLQTRLAAWYQQMQQRRAALGTNPAAVTAFNAEAAAYSALNAVAKEELAAFTELRDKRR